MKDVFLNKISIFFIRLIFFILVFFEFLNTVGILHYDLEFSWLGLLLTACFVWFGLEIIFYYYKKRHKFLLPVFVFFVPFLNIFVDALGDIFHWYGKFSWYDQMAHLLSGIASAALIFFITKIYIDKKRIRWDNKLVGSFAIGLSTVFGVLYELEEYAESLFLHNNRLGDRFDTPNDLFFNLIGAFLGTLVAILIWKMKKSKS